MEKEEKSLGLSLFDTIKSSQAVDIIKDVGEIIIDSGLSEGILKQIPIINWFVSGGKLVLDVRDYLFIQKVFSFIDNLGSKSEFEKCEEWRKIIEDEKYAEKVGETIVLYLDRLDSLEKPALLAKVTASYFKGEIANSQFLRLASSIDRTSMLDLEQLIAGLSMDKSAPLISKSLCERLYLTGLGELDFDVKAYEENIVLRSRGGAGNKFDKFLVYKVNQLACDLAYIINRDNYAGPRPVRLKTRE